jgi:iron uptake system component EfeO
MRRSLLALLIFPLAFGACASEPGERSANTHDVEAKDHFFEPKEIRAQPGSMTFRVRNTGTEIHEFEIFEGPKLVDEVEDITPGLERTLTVTLKAGTYEYACKFDDHYERGMKGTLKVEG